VTPIRATLTSTREGTLVRPARCGRLWHRPRCAWQDRVGPCDIGDDPIVVVLTENASDPHLEGLRGMASPTSSPESAPSILARARHLEPRTGHRTPGGERRRVTNGAFLRAGLIDEISLAYFRLSMGRKAHHASLIPAKSRSGSSAPRDDAGKQRGARRWSCLAPLSSSEWLREWREK